MILDNILRATGGALISILVARYLGAADYGLLNYALAFTALFGSVAKLGMDRIVVRDLVKHPENAGSILGTIYWLKLIISVLVFTISIIIGWIIKKDWFFVFLVALISVRTLFNAMDAYDIYYQTQLKSKFVVIPRSIAFTIIAIFKYLLIIESFTIAYFAASYSLEIAIGSLIIIFIYKRKNNTNVNWIFDKAIAKKLLKDGWPLIVTTALIAMHMRVDQLMIGGMLGNSDVGVFSVAVRISEIWLFIPMFAVQTVAPHLLSIREHNHELFHLRMVQLYSAMFWIGAIFGILTILYGRSFIVLLFGEEYRTAYLSLVWIIWTGIFRAQGIAGSVWMVGKNDQTHPLIINSIAVLINIILNFVFIPRYGISGAAFSTLISNGTSTWIVPLFFKETRTMNIDFIRGMNPKHLFVL